MPDESASSLSLTDLKDDCDASRCPTDAAVFARLARERRSIRRYGDRQLPRSLVSELIDTATRAPSNFNSQPWRFVVADHPDARQKLVTAVEEQVARLRGTQGSVNLFYVLEHIAAWLHPLREGSVVVLAFYRRNPEVISRGLGEIPGAGDVLDYNPNLLSLGMALQNLLIDAHARGIGACALAGPVPFLRGIANELLQLSSQLELAAVVAIGYPAENPAPPSHRSLSRVLSFMDIADGEVRLSL